MTGGTLDVNLTEQAVEAKGAISIKGVPAELAWQRIFYTPDDRQPPIQGDARASTPRCARSSGSRSIIWCTDRRRSRWRSRGSARERRRSCACRPISPTRSSCSTAWAGPSLAGRAATLMLDVVPKQDGSTDLANLKIIGDDINIQGGVALDAEQRLKEFYFSDFSVNSLTHVEITATVRDDQVLEIKAEGPSYDGKQFFQSLFSAGQLDASAEPADPFGVDLDRRDRHRHGLLRHHRQGR